MPMPKQLQDQQAFSEEFDRQVKEAQTQPEPTPPPEPQPAAPAPQPAPAPAPQPDADDVWKQRYLSLQGMFNSTVPQLQQQLKDLQAELAKSREAKPPEPPPKPQGKLVTDADVQAFGGDLIDVIRRGAQEQLEALQERHTAEITALRTELAKAQQGVTQVSEVQTKSVRDQFFSTLESRIPQWEQIQGTAECQNWLGSRVPGTQNTWNDALIYAAERFDVESVAEVFGEFFSRYPALNPAAAKAPAPAPAPRNREELNRQVTPPKSHAATPTPSGDKRTYSGHEYEVESMKIVRLTQQGKAKEAAALDAELNAALAEGRVRP
jgi:pyruvate/2-oxoglutarate dehydrogenase complex dihydrolipoamide acyltransferase (E2) component